MANLNQYPEGTLVTIFAQFKDKAGANADPATLTILWQYLGGGPGKNLPGVVQTLANANPAGLTNVTAPIRRMGIGAYETDIDTTLQPGRFLYDFEGTGGAQAVGEAEFIVTNRKLRGGS